MSSENPLAVAATCDPGMAACNARMSGVAWIAVPKAEGCCNSRKLRYAESGKAAGERIRSTLRTRLAATDWAAEAIQREYRKRCRICHERGDVRGCYRS